jgi:hypothetical protein
MKNSKGLKAGGYVLLGVGCNFDNCRSGHVCRIYV